MDEELKYLDYFGLGDNPIPVAPDYQKFFLSDHIDLVISEIVHGIVARKGFMVLTGDVGLGKTTLSRKIISILEEKNVESSLVLHTMFEDAELLREINRDFGIESDSLHLSDQLRLLNGFLIEQNRKGRNCAIIIDDSQNLNLKNLELVRMISNLETNSEKLVQVLLIGQLELLNKLNLPEMSQLKSRVIISEEAHPLNQEELQRYINFKLNIAGNQGKTNITNSSFRAIFKYTGGNFRKVNILMDRCLYVAFLKDTTNIDRSIVDEAEQDLYNSVSPKKRTPRYVWPALVIILLAATLAGAVYFEMIPGIPLSVLQETTPPPPAQAAPPPAQQDTAADTATPVAAIPEAGAGGKSSKPAEQKEPKEKVAGIKLNVPSPTVIPQAVSDFLAHYHLSGYEIDLYRAMETVRFKDVQDTIWEETGYHLILLETLPEKLRNDYTVLEFVSNRTATRKFILFWKPTVVIPNFYLGYQGTEIKILERLLAARKFYTYEIDGIVGSRLMKALGRFQNYQGLPVTGTPDTTTIFFLCQGG